MGLLLPLLIVLPLWCLLVFWARSGRVWTTANILISSFVVLAAALATQRVNYEHYCIPAIYFLPVLMVFARRCAWRTVSFERAAAMIAGLFLFLIVLYWLPLDLRAAVGAGRKASAPSEQ